MSLVIGASYYLRKASVFHMCKLVRLLPDMGGTAKVSYYSDGELLTCRQSELLTEDEYKKILKDRQKAAYRKDREIALRSVIDYWKNGILTPEDMLSHSRLKDLTYWKRQIAQAKKHNFISDGITPAN